MDNSKIFKIAKKRTDDIYFCIEGNELVEVSKKSKSAGEFKSRRGKGPDDIKSGSKSGGKIYIYSSKKASNEQKRRVMKRAWNRARRAAEKYGGKASDYMWGENGALANAWKSEKGIYKDRYDVTPIDANSDGEISKDEIKYNMLVAVLEDAQNYSGTTAGAIMENDNGSKFLEYLEDVRKRIGVEAIIANIEKTMSSVNSLAKLLAELVRAHYDPTYASWATNTENFKSELRKIAQAVEGETSDSLVNEFDFA